MSSCDINPAGSAGQTNIPPAPPANADIPDKLCNLPPFAPIASKILQLSSDDDAETSQLAKVIESEPAFAADVLRLANSPLFGLSSRVSTISHALVLLGLERTKSMALTIATKAYLHNTLKIPAVRQCWLHSLACAELASELSVFCGMRKERAYTAGLMHDVGRLALLKSYSKEYVPLLTTEYKDREEHLRTEQCLFGVDHCKAGSWLTRVWSFPQEITTVAERHHEAVDGAELDLLGIVKLSCLMADSLKFAAVRTTNPRSFQDLISQLPANLSSRITAQELEEKIVNRVQNMES